MDRRGFLSAFSVGRQTAPQRFGNNAASSTGNVRPLATGLEPYVPSANAPWDWIRAGHLLRRTTMMPTWSDIVAVAAMTPSQAVDTLLNTPSTPPRPTVADNTTESLDGLDITLISAIRAQWAADAQSLRKWYEGVLQNAGLTIIEKMVLFWSGHFTTEFVSDEDYVIAPLLYRQNDLFRQHGLGNFKDLVLYVTLDGAMLVYLGGNLNSAGKPNENYGRELMELFTTGLGQYTEGDIQNAARILTGWRVAQYKDKPAPNGIFNTYFLPDQHNTEAKEFLGVSFPARDSSTNTEFIVRRDEIKRLIDTIFEKRAEAVAKFISRKIYRFFVYSNPADSDEQVISAMADLFIANNFEIKPVISALLKSAHFFDNANIGAQVKTPAEFMIGLSRQLTPIKDMDKPMMSMGQTLFDPPDVSGWPGYHSWITTSTFPVRSETTQSASGLDDATTLAFIQQFPNYTNADDLVTAVSALLLPRHLSDSRKANLISKLVGGGMSYEWTTMITSDKPTAARNFREVIKAIFELPDFQLC